MKGENDSITKKHENERGIYTAYEHAYKNGIKEIIHLGDLIEGNSNSNQLRIENVERQIEYLKKFYPDYSDINTYLLYGNHDYNAIKFDHINNKFYKDCKNMKLIGANISYINFCGYPIKLSHECDALKKLPVIELPYCFELSGHSHTFNMYEFSRIIKAPNLSSASIDKDSIGYLEMINEENEFLFKFFNDNGKEISRKEKKLMKLKSINQ